jgi:hypothetical protein
MGLCMLRARTIVSGVLILGAFVIAAPSTAAAENDAQQAPPTAEVMATLDLAGKLQWYYRNDVGILLVYADGRLYRLDLLAGEIEPQDPLVFPGLDQKNSVIPVARTGLLLVPNAPFQGKPPGSHAIDTLTGEIRWHAAALPGIDVLFSFPDAGLVVVRSPDDGGRLIAIDLLTGERVWEIAKWARMIWTEAPYIRVMVENTLLTLDVHTGKSVREDDVTLPESKRLHAYTDEGVFLLWSNKQLIGYSIPPPPPAAAAPPGKLWEFKAASLMMGGCIKAGNCYIRKVGHDFLLVRSATRNEVIRLTTGEQIVNLKKGMFPSPVNVSPTGEYIASAASDGMRIHDGGTGELVYHLKYPKGGEGMKTLRYTSWPTDDLVMTVFPDKKGNPRRMIGHSCSDGSLVWTTVLPDVADYLLTSEQRAKLVGRIVMSLVMTAVSAANPVSVGGDYYFAVFVPNLNVSESLAPDVAPVRGGEAGGKPPFATAMDRYTECERRINATSGKIRYFVAGSKKAYDILRIDLVEGGVDPARRYKADTVHAIAPLPAFERAVTLENDNRRVRLLRLK